MNRRSRREGGGVSSRRSNRSSATEMSIAEAAEMEASRGRKIGRYGTDISGRPITPLMVLLAELLMLQLFTAVFRVGDANLAEMERAGEHCTVVAVTKIRVCRSHGG